MSLLKRRPTVFTGISGSGKSSLVFGTIAAESQRLINETYSAFVPGFLRRWRGPRSMFSTGGRQGRADRDARRRRPGRHVPALRRQGS